MDEFISDFNIFTINEKREYLHEIANLIIQLNVVDGDVDNAVINSGLKPIYTPCIIIKKWCFYSNLEKILLLPNNELGKALF